MSQAYFQRVTIKKAKQKTKQNKTSTPPKKKSHKKLILSSYKRQISSKVIVQKQTGLCLSVISIKYCQ